jgi:hypothetical protein
MWRLMTVVRNDVSEEHIASIIKVKRGRELGTKLLLTSCCERSSYLADSFHPDDGGDTFTRNVGTYKSHTAYHPEDAFFIVTAVTTSNLTLDLRVSDDSISVQILEFWTLSIFLYFI